MKAETSLDRENLQKIEANILSQVMQISKSMIESFKFKMIYGIKVTESQNKETLKHLKKFRSKKWDKTVSQKEAYKKYLKLYT